MEFGGKSSRSLPPQPNLAPLSHIHMSHPIQWWLQSPRGNDNGPTNYQSIEQGADDMNTEDQNESESTNNPLHDLLNNTILSYCVPNNDTDAIENQSSSVPQSSNSSLSTSSHSSSYTLSPPHKTVSVLVFDLIRFIAVSSDCRLMNTELMPMFWSGVNKTISWQIHRGQGVMGGEGKMQVLHVALR